MKKIKSNIEAVLSGEYFKNIFDLYSKINVIKYTLICVIFILIIDKYNILTSIISGLGAYITIIFLFLILVKILQLNIFDLGKLKTVNYFDFVLLVLILTIIFYVTFTIIIELNIFSLKIISCIIIFVFTLVLIIYRLTTISIKYSKIEKYSNVYDLKDLYDSIIANNDDLIFINDKESNFDLLNRGQDINRVYNIIANCKSKENFVVSLTGPWGSGKSTILNRVKIEIENNKIIREEIVLIDNFEPWLYENQESLFRGMFDSIMKKIENNFSLFEIQKFIEIYNEIIFSNFKININSMRNHSKEIENIKKMVNNYLKINNKRIVFIIDNIERASAENILFLFKVIFNVFDFDKTLYVLVYDEEQMLKQLENNLDIDYSYLEKIIQLEIPISPVSRDTIHSLSKICFTNLLKLYGGNIIDYDYIIDNVINDIKDVRDIKRTINSVFNINDVNNNYLNKIDALVLELVAVKNNKLYRSLSENSIFLISEDYAYLNSDYKYDNKKFNNDAYNYYEKTFKIPKNTKYLGMLSQIFPYLKSYKDFKEISSGEEKFILRQEEHSYIVKKNIDEYKKNIKEKRVFNARFNEMYFMHTRNEFISIDSKINELVETINNMGNVNDKYIELINIFPNHNQMFSIQTLEFYIGDIKSNFYELFKVIINNLSLINDEIIFDGLNAKSRVQILLSEIINKADDNSFKMIYEFLKKRKHDLELLRGLIYWLNPEKQHSRNLSEDKYVLIKKLFDDKVLHIKKSGSSIYDDKNYEKNIIYSFFDDEEYLASIGKHINGKNIFRFLLDMISKSSGTNGFGYHVVKKNVEKIVSYNYIDEIIKNIKKGFTEDEKFLIDVYESSKKSDDDSMYDSGIYLDEERKIIIN